METFYVPIYVQAWPAPGGFERSALMVLRFDQVVRTFLLNVYCMKEDGTPNPNPVTAKYTIVEPHGNFAICKLDATDGFIAQWKAAQQGKGALPDESMISTTVGGLKTRMKNIRNQWKAVLDARGFPAAPTEAERALHFLIDLDLTGHHAGFSVLRESYGGALTVPASPTTFAVAHHWITKPPFYDPTQTIGPPLNIQVAKDMKAEMDAHPPLAPCRTMHYALEYGSISLILDTPVG